MFDWNFEMYVFVKKCFEIIARDVLSNVDGERYDITLLLFNC